MKKVSIVIPTYNPGNDILRAVGSVRAQTFADWELIVADDCSTDSTYATVENLAASDPRIRIVRMQRNSGSARQPIFMGANHAETGIICVMGQDDEIEPDFLERLYKRMTDTGSDCALCRMKMVQTETGAISYVPAEGFDFSRVITGREACKMTIGNWLIGCNGALVRKDIFLSCQDERHEMNMDEVDSRVWLTRSAKVCFADVNYVYHLHSSSITRKISPKLFDVLATNIYLLDFLMAEYADDKSLLSRQWDICYTSIKNLLNVYWQHENEWTDGKAIMRAIAHAYDELKRRPLLGSKRKQRLWLKLSRFSIFCYFCHLKYHHHE